MGLISRVSSRTYRMDDLNDGIELEPTRKRNDNDVEKKKKKRHKRRKITDEADLNEKVTVERLNADLVKFQTRKVKHKLTEIECQDLSFGNVSDVYFCHSDEGLSDFLKRAGVELKSDEKRKFNVITVSHSAMRCVDFKRLIYPEPDKTAKTAKLIGKIKLKDQINYIQSNKNTFDVCFASVNRFQKLLETNEISWSSITTIIFDWNFRDVKFKRMFDDVQIAPILLTMLLEIKNISA